jgi:hypothetical protein
VTSADDRVAVAAAVSQLDVVFTPEEAVMSSEIIKYWSNLARTGNPNKPGTSAHASL